MWLDGLEDLEGGLVLWVDGWEGHVGEWVKESCGWTKGRVLWAGDRVLGAMVLWMSVLTGARVIWVDGR